MSTADDMTGWLAEREGFDATAVLSTRSPKFQKKLPRPLSEDAAQAMIDTVELQSVKNWVAARDAAVVTLLYGCGLRISEAMGLTGADFPLPEVLRLLARESMTGEHPPAAASRMVDMWRAELEPKVGAALSALAKVMDDQHEYGRAVQRLLHK